MKMRINDALIRYNILSGLKYSDGEYSLPRELKIKLIKLKIELEKIFNDFNSYQEKCLSEVKTDEYNELLQVPESDRTEEQTKRLNEVVNTLNQEMNNLLFAKSMEEVDVKEFSWLTQEEFDSILEVNVENEVVINGNKFDGGAYVDLIYHAFVNLEEESGVKDEEVVDKDPEEVPSETVEG